MSDEERKAEGIQALPANLYEALQELSHNDEIKGALGKHIYERFMEAKIKEWDNYRTTVHAWELSSYLGMY